ncbi:MAG: DUF58 domain-containing protein [Ignavibacteria bacterium]|nr:DUF58 domain-containing protein [Ignavibacteria bacterium]
MDKENEYRKYLDPSALAKISNLELKAKFVVEGFMAGLHKSPYHGFSIEFAEHRQYMPGDDLRFLDWRVFARTEKYFIKQYEEETNLKAYILLDISKSMDFSYAKIKSRTGLNKLFGNKKSGSNNITKLEYGSYISASLARLMLLQRDAVSLTTYDTKIRKFIPPRSSNVNLKYILKELSETKATDATGTAACLHEIADKIKRRGIIIIISDLLDKQDEVLKSLRHFRYDKNEVIVFHILDPVELSFLDGNPVRLVDAETKEEIYSRPFDVKDDYSRAMKEFIRKYKDECIANNIDYVQLTTDTPFDIALLKYLNKRARNY